MIEWNGHFPMKTIIKYLKRIKILYAISAQTIYADGNPGISERSGSVEILGSGECFVALNTWPMFFVVTCSVEDKLHIVHVIKFADYYLYNSVIN